MILGIVGHGSGKFTPESEAVALVAIGTAIGRYKPDTICSGHSPYGGIDIWAEEAAGVLGLKTLIFAPKVRKWDAPGGFRERNLQIAAASDVVVCIVVKDFPPGYRWAKERQDTCYHCLDRNPPHVKSGGCWTAWKAKERAWIILE